MIKICRDCGKDKPLTEFSREKKTKDGLKSYCKSCMSERSKAYNRKNREKRLAYSKQYHEDNREALKLKSRQHYAATIEERRAYGRRYRKQYLKQARTKVATLAREYARMRRRTDPMFRVIANMRSRLRHLLNGYKSKRTLELTGCNREELKAHLEKQFKPGMSWKNYGKWHIDHIIALSKVNVFDESELMKVCHFTNLQPLWAADNIRKSNK